MMGFRLATTILILSGLIVHQACVPMYHGVSLSPEGHFKITDSMEQDGVFLGYRYGILEEAGNKRHARNGHRSGHQLIAMEIRNHRSHTLLFPEGFGFISGGDSLYIAGFEEAMTILSGESPEAWKESVEVDAPSAMFALEFFNTIKETRSNLNFLDDMMTHYIVPQQLHPGDTVRGVLCLKVKAGQKMQFFVRE